MKIKSAFVIVCLLLAAVLTGGLTGCKYINNMMSSASSTSTPVSTRSATYSQPTTTNPTTPGAQIWELTEQERGQKARVMIKPFSYSGDFIEIDSSPGWWIFGTQGEPLFKLPLGGNIAKNSPGDHWQFVGVSNAGGGYQTTANGGGTSDGQYPDAVTASGTITLNTQSPLGTVSGTVKWTAVRIQ